MVAAIVNHDVKWLAPAPFWSQKGVSLAPPLNGTFDQPSILRFDSDLFMDEFLALTAYRPQNLHEWVARPETWREPMPRPATAGKLRLVEPISQLAIAQHKRQAGAGADSDITAGTGTVSPSGTTPKPFKLFQPAHQRYYLVSAALVCRQPGLPDRAVDTGKQEQVGFVIRRFFHANENDLTTGNPRAAGGKEYAFVNTANGYAWKEIADDERERLQQEEERLPMFGITYDDNTYKRRLFAGVIPVGKREAYHGAAGLPNESGVVEDDGLDRDPRRMLFDAEVIAPWKALLEQSNAIIEVLKTTDSNPFDAVTDGSTAGQTQQRRKILAAAREQIQTGSWYVLLDFYKFLVAQFGDTVWEDLKNGTSSATQGDIAKTRLLDAIRSVSLGYSAATIGGSGSGYLAADVIIDLDDALIRVGQYEANLEAASTPLQRTNKAGSIGAGWPDFLFPFADPYSDSVAWSVANEPLPARQYLNNSELPLTPVTVGDAFNYLDALADLVEDALDATDGPLPELEPPPRKWNARNAWFVIRCVYERPNCGPIHPEILSHPTEPFQMAPFFEPDAPARPIRIPMPMDISPAGLRKYQRNTSLMISDMLCGKIKKIKRITFADLVLSVLPWPFHKDLPNLNDTAPCGSPSSNFGMFCSLSIPIVTLCALILLIIIVALFDMFFRWIPYLFVCFPLPGLRGKNNG